ncbi:MAG: hypothetical protein ACI814_002174 [Mariniblastus sp.]|jgi:hypothetical protein
MKICLPITAFILLGGGLFYSLHSPNRGFGESQQASAEFQGESGDGFLVSLGVNSNREIPESSGLARSSFDEDAFWTLNDSGQASRLFLLGTDGKILGNIDLPEIKNVDWEAMSQFKAGKRSYLLVADVGDNLRRRKNCQLILVAEPDLSKLPTAQPATGAKDAALPQIKPNVIPFSYEDGPRNCEAVCVAPSGKHVWLVEKVDYSQRKSTPGIYVLPLSTQRNQTPLVAKRIADFPIRNVTGMSFSPDGKHLIIRNYLNAHLFSRTDDQSWEKTIMSSKPQTVVLPLQRQGEAICFATDSEHVILTSEFTGQPIWRLSLKRNIDEFDRDKSKTDPAPTNDAKKTIETE